MRGKARGNNIGSHWIRITPAYAGKSAAFHVLQKLLQDHPRLCGEKCNLCPSSKFTLGSPPPMRGKDVCGGRSKTSSGITPAYAGKSRRITSSFSSMRDHPRLCGEKANPPAALIFRMGSPPPMRGKGKRFKSLHPLTGITPAYAGKSFFFRKSRRLQRDHPRLCGEKINSQSVNKRLKGSPPPMRGKAVFFRKQCHKGRITPAYAGKSGQLSCNHCIFGDHPRLCGEKPAKISVDGYVTGSPPPMRGKVAHNAVCWQLLRITPAYAGKSRLPLKQGGSTLDHPRLCGEKLNSGSKCKFQLGSPPPMRGKGQKTERRKKLMEDHPRLCGEK